jgi:hypothetical protein
MIAFQLSYSLVGYPPLWDGIPTQNLQSVAHHRKSAVIIWRVTGAVHCTVKNPIKEPPTGRINRLPKEFSRDGRCGSFTIQLRYAENPAKRRAL